MKLTPVGTERAEDLARLHEAAFDKPWSADEIAALIGGAGAFALMAEADQPLGMIMARRLFDEAEVLTLAVAPEARRRGLGRQLTQACAELLLGQETQSLFLEVGEDNPGAVALYETCGFVPAGRRKNYYDRGGRRVDALVMRLDLNSGRP